MKLFKNILMLIAISILAFGLRAQVTTFPLTESFDDAAFPGENGWVLSSTSDADWERVTSGAHPNCTPHSGAGLLEFKCWDYSKTESGLLISPLVNAQGKTLKLSFWMHRDGSGNSSYDSLKVYLNSTSSVSDANLLLAIDRHYSHTPYVESAEGWYQYSCTLPVSEMTDAYVIFEGVSDYGYNIKLDDISIIELLDADAEVLAITNPVSGKNLSSTEQVSVTLKNNGVNELTSLSLELKLGENEVATESWTGSIASGETGSHTFAASVDLSEAGDHNITVTATLADDENPSNDSKIITVTNTICGVASLPLNESFDNAIFPVCWNISSSDDKNWTRVSSAESLYPTCLANSGEGMLEFYSYNGGGQTGLLITPPIVAEGKDLKLSFWMYRDNNYSSSTDKVNVYLSNTQDISESSPLITVNRNRSLEPAVTADGWYEYYCVLPTSEITTAYVIFEGVSDAGYNIHIDDISIFEMPDAEVEVVAITEPVSGYDLTNAEQVSVTLKNNGGNELTSLSLELKLDDNITTTETWTGSIASGATGTYTFDETINLSAGGNYNITVTATLTGDADPSNNAKTITVSNQICKITSFPVEESFDGETFPPECWQSLSTDLTPWKRYTYTTHSGAGSLQFNSGTYREDNNGLLITPLLDVTDKSLELSFWMYRNNSSPTRLDLVNVYLNTTPNLSGATLIKTINRNYELEPVEAAAATGWYEYSCVLPTSEISSAYIIFEGVSQWGSDIYIDDISISEMSDIDVEVSAITSPVSGKDLSDAEQVSITLKNNGINPLTSVSLKLDLGEDEIVTETWTGNLASGASETYTFDETVDLSTSGEHVITVTATLAQDGNLNNNSKTITVNNTVCKIIAFPFNEDFENNYTAERSTCWTQEGSTKWTFVTSGGTPGTVHGGSYKARFYNSYSATTKLITPKIDLSGLTSPALKFWHTQRNTYYDDQDVLKIYYKTSAEGNWILLEDYQDDVSDWTERSIILPEKSADYYIAFEATSYDGNSVQLDDISVIELSGYVDMELSQIITPEAGAFTNLSNNNEVKVSLKNKGAEIMTDFGLRLQVNGETIDSISWEEESQSPIALGATDEYTFSNIDFSAANTYIINVTVFANTDQVAGNDSKSVSITNFVCETINTFPWSESADNDLFPPGCWISATADDAPWVRVATGEHPNCSPHSGAGLLSFKGWNYQTGKKGILVTPPVTLDAQNKNLKLSFWMYRDGSSGEDSLNVYLNSTSDLSGATLLTSINRYYSMNPSEVAANNWYEYSVSISTIALAEGISTGYIIFEGFSGYDNNIHLDDISIVDLNDFVDAEVVSINAPAAGDYMDLSDNETVTVSIKNNGGSLMENFGLRLQINGTTEDSISWEGSALAAGATETYNFNGIDLSATNNYAIEVTIFAEDDQMPENDSKSVTIKNRVCFVNTFPWEYGFEDNGETLSPCWTVEKISGVDPTRQWRLLGNSGWPSTVHGGAYKVEYYYWDEESTVSNSPSARLISPRLDLSEVPNPLLSFWHTQQRYQNNESSSRQDTLKVYYKNSAAGEWIHLVTYHENIADWQKDSLLLPNPSNDYYISFVAVSRGGYSVALDDISIANANAYTITASADINGSISPDGEVTLLHGGNQNFTITPNENYKIAQVLVDNVNNEAAVASGSYEFTNVTEDHTIAASFALKTYTVSFDANGADGTMTAQEFTHGVAQALNANEFTYSGKYFTGWAVTSNGTVEYSDEAEYTATADAMLYAVWADSVRYNIVLSAEPSEGGSISGDGEFNEGTEITVRAIANPEYEFVNWTEAGEPVSINADYTFTVTGNRTLAANFKKSSVSTTPFADAPKVTIYPNPSNGLLNVQVVENSIVKIFDLSGKMLGIYNVDANSELKLRQAPGMYFINVESNRKTSTHKVIVK